MSMCINAFKNGAIKMSQLVAEVYEIKPDDFKVAAQVSACYLEVDGHLLLLECSASKPEAGKWGVPGGKMEPDELPEDAAKRELFEETGIAIQHSAIQNIGTLYFRKLGLDCVYHLFKITLSAKPEVRLSNEHPAYLWASAQDLEGLPLMAGFKEALCKYQAALAQKRMIASVNAYLILLEKDQVLLLLRQNTGYLDGYWSLPAGHVEAEESATEGMIREAEEELGITIEAKDLKVVHVMHRKTNRLNVDIFFECRKWKGEIKNQEPQKCERVDFFPFTSLPSKTVDYNAFVLSVLKQGLFYSERGFV